MALVTQEFKLHSGRTPIKVSGNPSPVSENAYTCAFRRPQAHMFKIYPT